MQLSEHRNKWVVTVDGRRYSTGLDATTSNRAAAERKAGEIIATLAKPVGDTIGEIMAAYLRDKDQTALAPDRLHFAWKRLKPFFASARESDITRDACRRYAAQRDVQPATINKELRTLRAAIRWANPQSVAVVETLPEPQPRDRFLSRDEFARLLDASRETFHLTVFLHLAIATAGRKEALLDLTWMQVRWDRDEIYLGHKANGKKRATVPMTASLKAALQTAKDIAQTDHVVEYHGAKVENVRTAFAAACRRAGLEDLHIHDLRHTAAVWMCERGIPLEKISAFLGHSNILVTQRVYARHQPDHLRDAADALEL